MNRLLLLQKFQVFGNEMAKTWCVGGSHQIEAINQNA